MKRLKIKDTYHKIIDGFDVNESSREVKYSNVKIDFTGKGIEDLPLKYQECQLVDGDFRHIDADDGQRIEGTNLQVNQGSEKLSELEYVKGQTNQSGTPTPTTPQPINITTGRQVVSVCEKNILDLSGFITHTNYGGLNISYSNGKLLINGTATSNVDVYLLSTGWNTKGQELSNIINSQISYLTLSSTKSGLIYYFQMNGAYIQNTINRANPTDNITNMFVRIPRGTSLNNEEIGIQLERNSQPSTYEEYKGNDYEINLGKNLLKLNDIQETTKNGITYSCTNGVLKINGTATGGVLIDFDNVIIPKGTYYFNSKINNPSGSGSYARYITKSNGTNLKTNDGQIVLEEDTSLHFRFYTNANAVFNNAEIIGQLEKGTKFTSYSPYKTPIYLGEIRNTNNVVIAKDYIFRNTPLNPLYDSNLEEGQWYIHKEIGKVVLNGSENWVIDTSHSRFSLTGYITDYMINQRTTAKCNYYRYGDTEQDGYFALSGANNVLFMHYPTSSTNTVALFKTWLGSHNVELYYVLNTPTNTLIEDEELINQLNSIELLEGLNNVSVSSAYLSGIIGLHYNYQIEQDIEKVNEVIYTGYVNNYTLPKMKNKLEYRELDIDLLSPLALATLRTTDAVGTYNLRDLIREIIQPLIDDGFTLKELNVGNNQISVNYLTETIESSLNKLSNKFNFWWYIDKNKNIFINDISYIFNKNKVLTYDDNNKINGLIDFTPSMESIDYCNTIDFSNVRLFTYSYYSLRYRTIGGENIPYYTSYNPMFKKEILNPGDEITFDIPFVINTSKSGLTDTSYQTSDYCFKIEKKVGLTYPIAIQLLQDSNNQVIIPSNATISDSFNESKEFVFVRDNFFKKLIVGMKYNGSSAITISDISSTTALMLTKLRINDNEEIEKNKDIISTTGIVEKQIDANEQWLTYNQVLEIAKTLIGNNNVNVEKVNMLTDNENNLKVGDIITIDKPGFLTNGDFVITDKKRKYYDNVDQWEFVLNNTNILESYIDLFRSTDEQENEEEKFSLITGSYINEGVIEKYEVDVQ